MRFLQQYFKSVHNPLVWIWFSIWARVPDQSKRMFVLASLYVRLMNCNEDDTERLDDVNRTLGLSRDTRVLRTPAIFAPVIWKQVLPIDKIDPDQGERYISRLIKRTPCWLWYADLETRTEDLRQLMHFCRTHPCRLV